MKNRLVAIPLALALLLTGCTAIIDSDATGTPVESTSSPYEEAEAVLMNIYKPMILLFPKEINAQNPISPDDACDYFQCYAICERTAGNKAYDSWVIEGDELYEPHYAEEVVEKFAETYFKIPAEQMRTAESYTPNRNGYRFSIYSGKDQSVLRITDYSQEGTLHTFAFTYSWNPHTGTGECALSLRESEDGFYLEAYEGIIPEL